MNKVYALRQVVHSTGKSAKMIDPRFFWLMFGFSSLFSLLLRSYYFFYLFHLDQVQQNQQIGLLEQLMGNDTGADLVVLLSFLMLGCRLLLVVVGSYLCFYAYLTLKRAALLVQQDLAVRAQLGASPVKLTLEFSSRYLCSLITATFAGILVTALCYTALFNRVSAQFKPFLVTPRQFFIYYDLMYAWFILVGTFLLFLVTYYRLKRRYYQLC